MLDGPLLTLVVIAAVGCALNGGIFFAFSTFVMSALKRLPPAEGLAAMQQINVTAVTPAFMSVFLGTGVLCLAATTWALVDWNRSSSALVVAGAAAYLLGVFGMTAAFHVPRNNALAAVDPADADAPQRWARHASNWTTGNHVRTAAGAAAAALLVIATQVG